jgi:hypothetical protein
MSCLILFAIGIHFKSNKKLKKVMIINSLVKAMNMYLNNQYSGMLINLVNFFRNILSLKALEMKKSIHFYFCFFIGFYCLINFFIEDKYWYLPILGSSFGLFSLFYMQKFNMRLFLFIGSNIWFLYAILHNNFYGVFLGTFTIISFFSSFYINRFNFNN